MRTLKYSKGCRIEVVRSGDSLLLKMKGNCPREKNFAEDVVNSIQNRRIILK